MFDPGSRSYDDNVAETREAVRRAHSDGLWLEAELGYIGGKPGSPAGAHQPGVRTDPGEAAAFVAATGVDALAVAVGSSHAMTTATAVLDHELIARLRSVLAVPLVLHGSSGVAVAELRAAVAAGIVKVNVGTALNVAFTQALRVALRDVTIVDPRTYLDPARTAITGIAHELLAVLGAQR
jgi:fructose-bisphosphate aldolase class II